MPNNITDFSRRNFIGGIGATLVALPFTSSTLEALVLPQEPRIITPQEAIADENNSTGARQLYINQEANWVMGNIAKDFGRQVYWIDELVYDHQGRRAEKHVRQDVNYQMKIQGMPEQHITDFYRYLDDMFKGNSERLKREFERGNYKEFRRYAERESLRLTLLSGSLVDVDESEVGLGKEARVLFFPMLFDGVSKGHDIPGMELPNYLEPSEGTIRMNIAEALYFGLGMHHGVHFDNSMAIDHNNRRMVSPEVINHVVGTDAFIRNFIFTRKYLNRQVADFALNRFANSWVHATPFVESESVSSRFNEFERNLLQANYDKSVKYLSPYLPK